MMAVMRKARGRLTAAPSQAEFPRLDVIGPPGEERPEGQEDEELPQADAHELHRRGGIEQGRAQTQQADDGHPGTAQINQDQAASHSQAEQQVGHGLDLPRAHLPVLNHPAAAAKRGEIAVQGIAAEGVVVIVDQVGSHLQGGHSQGREAEKEEVPGVVCEIGQGRGRGHRKERAGEKGEPGRPAGRQKSP